MHNANERQVGGQHYATDGVQHWDYAQQALDGEYLMGNVTKYVARHRRKNGLQDLEKANHYLMKICELYETGALQPARQPGNVGEMPSIVNQFINDARLTYWEGAVMVRACLWSDLKDLGEIRQMIGYMVEVCKAKKDLDEARAAEAGAGYVDQARDEPAPADAAEQFALWLSVQSPAFSVGSGAETPVLLDALGRYHKFCKTAALRSS